MDILKTIGKTTVDLAKNENILNKSTNFFGMLFPYVGLEKKALDLYIENIEKSDMASEAKLIAVLNAKDTIKKLKNKQQVAEIAVGNAKEGTDFSATSGVDEEWLERFMDSAGFVSSHAVQLMWGQVLSREFERPGSTPLNMTRILSEITPTYAKAFRKICGMQSLVIENNDNGNFGNAIKLTLVPYQGNEDFMRSAGLSFEVFNELDSLGLIKFDFSAGYVSKAKVEKNPLVYADEKKQFIIEFNGGSFPVGNVLLTSAGKYLEAITTAEKVDGYGEMVKRYLIANHIKIINETNYQVLINGNEIEVTE